MTFQSLMVLLYIAFITVMFWKLIRQRDDLRERVNRMKHPWIVGQYIPPLIGKGHATWQFQGVFSSEEDAVAACLNQNYFVAPAIMDMPIPNEPMQWPGIYYPRGDLFSRDAQQE